MKDTSGHVCKEKAYCTVSLMTSEDALSLHLILVP